jgi:uncharacterized ion transporter superfamily protein YfcC
MFLTTIIKHVAFSLLVWSILYGGYGVQRHFQQYFRYIVVVSLVEGTEENHRSAASHLQQYCLHTN